MSFRQLFLCDKIPWFGAHSGYELLPKYIGAHLSLRQIAPRGGLMPRLIGKGLSLLRGAPERNQASACAELEFICRSMLEPGSLAHILYIENHMEYLHYWPSIPRRLCGTIHLPISQWSPQSLGNLSRMRAAITLHRRGLSDFAPYIPEDRLHFVHFGVDTDFFFPKAEAADEPRNILYSGLYLRNTGMLARVFQTLHARHPHLIFDFLIPTHARGNPDLQHLLAHPAVRLHANLSDEKLRALYQRSYLMLLPLNESGANTSVVEALASGLPVVTTDIGGIRDYGGGDVFPIVANNDDDGMINLVERYLSTPRWRNEMSARVRRFAEEYLAWPLVARQHLEVFKGIAA